MKPVHYLRLRPRVAPVQRRDSGVTMIELLVTIAVAAILLTIAIPSFVKLTQTNRVAGEVNSLAGDLEFARAEAIKEGLPVSLCASSNGTSCLGTGTWNTGWIVFSDPNGNQSVDAGDLVLRKQIPWKSTDTFVAADSKSKAVGAISYSRDGFAINLAGTVTWTLHTQPLNTSATRCLTLNLIGHQQVVTNGQAAGTGTCS